MRRTAARAARASRSAREYLPKAFPSLDADDVARELFDDARAVATRERFDAVAMRDEE